jgi:hypothetical protein
MLPSPRELLQNLVVTANKSLPIHGMYYSTHNLVCIQVTGAGHNAFAARARLEMQGTGMAAREKHGVDAEVLHMTNSADRLVSVDLGCRIVNGAIWEVRNAEENGVHRVEVVCMDWCGVLVFQEALLAYNVP